MPYNLPVPIFLRMDTMPHHPSHALPQLFRNGQHLEKKGRLPGAIACYEACVSGAYPAYNRLRIIYTDRKRYADAIRVCQAYVAVANSLLNRGSPQTDVLTKRARFLNYIERLELAKNNKQPPSPSQPPPTL
jgi:tetratricopeptide (TPR) repeat protein